MFAVRFSLASVMVAAALGAPVAQAQTAPVQYWIPGWPVGFSSGSDGSNFESYGNFPSFIADGENGFFSRRYSYTGSWSAFGGGLGLQGFSPYAASFGPLTTEGSQFGYKFKNGVSLFGGFDTLRADRGSSAFAAFDSNSATLPVYSAHGGIAFQPTANTTLSFGFSYTGQGSDRLDSDIRSPALPGETPAAFTSGRR